MTANLHPGSERAAFYLVLELALCAWTLFSLTVGHAVELGKLPLAILTMGGMLAILGAAMRHPLYLRLRDDATR
jgi:ribose/xylose/arabinose/galactoside ABC-type transport system permease subunit